MSDIITEKEKLIASIATLKAKIKTLESEILSIKQSDTYKTINSIDDWDSYFRKKKEILEKELHNLQMEIKIK